MFGRPSVGQISRFVWVELQPRFELAVSGELFERLSQRGHFSERDAVVVLRYVRSFFTQRQQRETDALRFIPCSVLSGVKYLHGHGIAQQDLRYVAPLLYNVPSRSLARPLGPSRGLWTYRTSQTRTSSVPFSIPTPHAASLPSKCCHVHR